MAKLRKMVPPSSECGNIYARGMETIFRYLGIEISYEHIMGLTGVAFILQVDTRGPYISNEELDCAWWPNDDWGFELGIQFLTKATGWEINKLTSEPKTYRANPAQEYTLRYSRIIEKSLQAGKPVLAYGFIGLDLDDQEPPLLGYGTVGKSTQYSNEIIRIEKYPWQLYFLGRKTDITDKTELDLLSVEHIINLFYERAQEQNSTKTRYSGKQAWSEWLNILHSGDGCDNNMLIHLRYNRSCAVNYLRNMAERHCEKIAKHLIAASNHYQTGLNYLMKQEFVCDQIQAGISYDKARAGYIETIEKVFNNEQKAIAELEKVFNLKSIKRK